MEITVYPLRPDSLKDFLYFFDNMTFADHPDWSICYCYSFHFTGSSTEWKNKDRNRSSVIKLIKENKMRGYLAYINGKTVGWCNINDKTNFERLKINENIWDDNDDNIAKIASIVCFLIDPRLRGQGIASTILDRICIDYKKLGYKYIEAYPKKANSNNEEQCQGPLSLYINKDFNPIKLVDDFVIVRKAL